MLAQASRYFLFTQVEVYFCFFFGWFYQMTVQPVDRGVSLDKTEMEKKKTNSEKQNFFPSRAYSSNKFLGCFVEW